MLLYSQIAGFGLAAIVYVMNSSSIFEDEDDIPAVVLPSKQQTVD